jgi:hypothetical protein
MGKFSGEQLDWLRVSQHARRFRQLLGEPVFRARGFRAWKLLAGGFLGATALHLRGHGTDVVTVEWCRFWRRPYPVAEISRGVASWYFGADARPDNFYQPYGRPPG